MSYAIRITETTDLGIAMLIAEFKTGAYVPVSSVVNLQEAREIARSHSANTPSSEKRPRLYRVWARGRAGAYESVAEIAL